MMGHAEKLAVDGPSALHSQRVKRFTRKEGGARCGLIR